MNNERQGAALVGQGAAIYAVDLAIEYLPGLCLRATGSIEFSCSEVAKASLSHVQKTYPNARLRKEVFTDPSDEMKRHFKLVEYRTEQLRKLADSVA